MKPRVRSPSFVSRILVAVTISCALIVTERMASAAVPVVGLWRFNEGTGTNINDSSGFNNNGTLAGENGNIPAWVAGQSGFWRRAWFHQQRIGPRLCQHTRQQLAA